MVVETTGKPADHASRILNPRAAARQQRNYGHARTGQFANRVIHLAGDFDSRVARRIAAHRPGILAHQPPDEPWPPLAQAAARLRAEESHGAEVGHGTPYCRRRPPHPHPRAPVAPPTGGIGIDGDMRGAGARWPAPHRHRSASGQHLRESRQPGPLQMERCLAKNAVREGRGPTFHGSAARMQHGIRCCAGQARS